eukprot:scaffold1785_cov95-Isochrysis_galbana.AAC.7
MRAVTPALLTASTAAPAANRALQRPHARAVWLVDVAPLADGLEQRLMVAHLRGAEQVLVGRGGSWGRGAAGRSSRALSGGGAQGGSGAPAGSGGLGCGRPGTGRGG